MNEDTKYVRIGDVIHRDKGIKPNNLSSKKSKGFFPYIDIKAFEKNIFDSYTNDRNCLMCKEGDLLIVWDGARAGLTGFAHDGAVCSTLSKIYIDGMDNRYLRYFLESNYTLLNTKNQGSGTPHIKPEILNDLIIRFPSREEQLQIVEKIEKLLVPIDEGLNLLISLKHKVKQYIDSVTVNAFSVDNLMKYGFKNKEIKDVCYSIRVGIVIKPTQYYTDKELGVPAVRTANIGDIKINNDDWVYITKEGNILNKKSIIHQGDVIIARSGSPGKSCVVTPEFDGCNAIDIIIATPNTDEILPEYLCAYNNSPFGKVLVKKNEHGMGLKHLNVGEYSSLKIPVPNTDIQREIASNINNQLVTYISLKNKINILITNIEKLKQSIFQKAYSGELL